jgi:hypothetical protein
VATENSRESRRTGVYRAALEALRFARSEIDRLEVERDRLQNVIASRDRQLESSADLQATSDVFEGGLGNRPALEQYRNTNLARFMQHVNDVGVVSREHGPDAARFLVRTSLRADLACLFVAPPRTVQEARRRDLLRVLLSNPASAAVLAGSEPWHERFREDLINLVLNAGVEGSTWELVRRSAEDATSGGGAG